MKYLKDHVLLLWVVSLVLMVAVLNATTPESVGPGGIALFFAFFYFFSFMSILLLARRLFTSEKVQLADSQIMVSIGFLAMVPVVAVGLQSLGQLIWRDVIILLGLSSLAIFYWMKRR